MNDTLCFYGKLKGTNTYIPLFKYDTLSQIGEAFSKYTLIPCVNIIGKINDGAKIDDSDLSNILSDLKRDNDNKYDRLYICKKYMDMSENTLVFIEEINELETIIANNDIVIAFCETLVNILNSAEDESGVELFYIIIN